MIETKKSGMQKLIRSKGNSLWALEEMVKRNLIPQEKFDRIKSGEIFYNEVLGLTTAKELNEAVIAKAIRKYKDISGATRWIATSETRVISGKKKQVLSSAYESSMIRRQKRAGAAYYESQANRDFTEPKEKEHFEEIKQLAADLFQ